MSSFRSSYRLFSAILIAVCLSVVQVECVYSQSNVLIFSSGDASQDSALRSLLEDYGHKVILGEEYPSYTGGGLNGIDVVVLQANLKRSGTDMPLSGQDELLNFVARGGGLITSELPIWKGGAAQEFSALRSALPVIEAKEPVRPSNTVTYTQNSLDATLNAGLPASFSTGGLAGSEMIYVPRPGATVFFQSSENQSGNADSGVIGWSYGAGRVLSFPTLMSEVSEEEASYSMLIHNSIRWTASVPEPSAGLLTVFAVMGLGLHRRRSRLL